MNLIKTSALNAVAVSIKILTLLGLNKILAIYVGPAGYATLGQFQNAVQMIMTVASGAFNAGVTRYTAQYHDDIQSQYAIWRTAGTLALTGSLITSAIIVIFNKALAGLLLKNEQYGTIFILFGFTLVFFVFNTLLLAILNGKKQIKRYIVANIAGSLFSLFVTALMAVNFGLYGALISLALHQSLSFFVTFFLCHKISWFKLRYFFGKIDFTAAKNLSKYSLMAIVSALSVPVSQLLVRNYIGDKLGWEQAGYWEAMSRLSSAYLMFVTSTLSLYYLPRLSEIKTRIELKIELLTGYKLILPVSIVCSLLVYLFRHVIITLLFTPDFFVINELFAWQLVGDTLKIASWLLAYVFIAKGFVRLFIVSEVIFSLLFFFLVVVLENRFKLQAAVMAYAINYFLYLIFVFTSLKYSKVL
jgi:polysaccharide transporter, PST family